jgi:hypothetical protein
MPDPAPVAPSRLADMAGHARLAAKPERDPSDSKTWTVLHFSQSNPIGEGQGDVAALLRRVADTVDSHGDIDVQDITFQSSLTDGEDDLTMTVYYHDQPRRR